MAFTVIQCVTLVILPHVADCIHRPTHFEFYSLPIFPSHFKTLLSRIYHHPKFHFYQSFRAISACRRIDYHHPESHCYQTYRDLLHRTRHISTNYFKSMCYQSFDFGICSVADYNSAAASGTPLSNQGPESLEIDQSEASISALRSYRFCIAIF